MSIYIQFDGIKGNVTAKGHDQEKWLELYSVQFGVGRGISSGSVGRETNREASIASISEISITREMDEATPLLFIEACIGTAKKVTIHLSRTGDNIQNYMEYTLSNVLISSYSMRSQGDSHPSESLTLNFDKIEMNYIPYDKDNKPTTSVRAGYDLVQAQKASG